MYEIQRWLLPNMAKIHNPQNQEGINLVNEKIFNEQVASLNDAIAKEVADREAAVTAETKAREAAITAEATARTDADAKEIADREAAITAEATAREEAITAETKARISADAEEIANREAAIAAEATRATEAEEELLTKITEETGRAEDVENSIKATIGEIPSGKNIAQIIEDEVTSRTNGDKTLNELVENISGTTKISYLDTIPETTVSWVAVAIKQNRGADILGDKLVKAIEFKTTTAVEGERLLAVYTPGVGTPPAKNLIALSEPTTINAGTTIFSFASPFLFNQDLELYLVDSAANAPSISSGDPALPSAYITSPAVADSDGSSWKRHATTGGWNNNTKNTFHIVYHIAGQIDIVKNALNNAIDEVKTSVNANTQNLNALSTKIGEETTNRENAVTTLLGSIEAEITRAENAEQNIADNTHLYDGKFGNWDLPSDRRDKATCNYFKLTPTKSGYIKSLRLLCRPDGSPKPPADKTFIQIAREDGTDIDNGRSINACEHALNAESLYEFDKECLLEKGSTYRFKFIGEESGSIIEACITTTKTVANGATAEELFGGNIVGSIGAVECQAIFEIVLLNKVQADSEKVALIDSLPTYADVNGAILIALNDYPTTESVDTKLENYQLKSEVEESSDRYKFIPGDNSSAINVNFADIETNGNFSGGVTTSIPGISGNIGEQTARFNNEIGLSLTNPDGEMVCSASIALNMGSPEEFGGMPGALNEITYGEYSTLEEYGITLHPYFNNETGNFAWTISEYSGYEGLRTGWNVSIGNEENRIQKTISGGQPASTSHTQATLAIPQNIYKVDIISGTTVETYTVGEAFNGTLCTVNGDTLTAVAQGSSGNNLHAVFYAKNNQPVNKTIVLNLNKDNSKVITANAAFNAKQLNPAINDGTVLIEVTIESTDSSGYIILNTICDSTTYDNAQYVCHVVPVSITA